MPRLHLHQRSPPLLLIKQRKNLFLLLLVRTVKFLRRGRGPRKVLPPNILPVAPNLPDPPILQATKQNETMQQQSHLFNKTQWLQHPIEQRPQSQQFLLAIFALFSFFSLPLTSSYSTRPEHHSYTGTVLNALHPVSLCP